MSDKTPSDAEQRRLMARPWDAAEDMPVVRVHEDGRVAVETAPGYWVLLRRVDPDRECVDAVVLGVGSDEVHGPGWRPAAVVGLPDLEAARVFADGTREARCGLLGEIGGGDRDGVVSPG